MEPPPPRWASDSRENMRALKRPSWLAYRGAVLKEVREASVSPSMCPDPDVSLLRVTRFSSRSARSRRVMGGRRAKRLNLFHDLACCPGPVPMG